MKCSSLASERIQVRLPSFAQRVVNSNPRTIKKKGAKEKFTRGQAESRVVLETVNKQPYWDAAQWLNCVVFYILSHCYQVR